MKKYLLFLAMFCMHFTVCKGGEISDLNSPLSKYKCDSNEILYISESCALMNLSTLDGWDVNLTSNTYGEDGVGRLKFDAAVTYIPRRAFYQNDLLRYIKLPDSVTRIGSGAFEGCSSLTSVTIPDSVTKIGENVFTSCESLKAFYGKFASADNRCLIVDGVLNSFAPSGLTEYTIPNNVTKIKDCAFCFCSSLTSVTIPNSVTLIGGGAFYGCSSLRSITIPNSVTRIKSNAFRSCISLTSVTIGNSVTKIGNDVFMSCENLKAFYGKFASADNRCLIVDGVLNSFAPSGLTEYTIPNGVITIGNSAFSGCSSLTTVTIPNGVTTIQDYAFNDCTSLASIYCKPTTPPDGGYHMFNGNAPGLRIYVPMQCESKYKSKWGYTDAIVGYYF